MRWLVRIGVALAVLFVVAQLVPYGRDHENPTGAIEPAWASPEGRALVKRACFDCHSHETVWPWYSSVAPVSWIVQAHVEDGRKHLNFSAWDRAQKHAKHMAEEVKDGEMPMPPYLLAHPEARLSPDEKTTLMAALDALPRPGPAAAPAPSDDEAGAEAPTDESASGDAPGDDDEPYEG